MEEDSFEPAMHSLDGNVALEHHWRGGELRAYLSKSKSCVLEIELVELTFNAPKHAMFSDFAGFIDLF